MVRHLIDKETAIKDMVSDYSSSGNRLIEGYEKGRQDHIDSRRANSDRRHQKLVEVFEEAQADRERISNRVVPWHIRGMKAQWEAQQEVLKGSMAAALAACTE